MARTIEHGARARGGASGSVWGGGQSSSEDLIEEGIGKICSARHFRFYAFCVFYAYERSNASTSLLLVVVCPAVACAPRPPLPLSLGPHHVHDIIKILVLDCH